MDSFSNLLQRYEDASNRFRTVFQELPIAEKASVNFVKMSKIHDALEKHIKAYRMEDLLLKEKHKEISSKLLTIKSKIQIEVMDYEEIVKKISEDHQRKIPSPTDVFQHFIKERVVQSREFQDIHGEEVSLKEIFKGFNKWAISNGARRMELKDLEQLCDLYFGDSKGTKKYKNIRVFLDEEDFENFMENHKETQ